MDKKSILDSVKKVREISGKKKFDQTFDISINLVGLNVKKADDKVDLFVQLPGGKGKEAKICAFVGSELGTKAKIFNKVILQEEFSLYKKDKKKLKKLAREFDFFVAQANLMAEVASIFGRVLGPLGKMPNPKSGCVVTPIADLDPLKKKLDDTVHLETKNQIVVKAVAGLESMKDESVTDNILSVYNSVMHSLPQEKNNIKSMFLKLTMGPSVEVTANGPVIHEKKKKKVVEEEKVVKKKPVKKEKVAKAEEEKVVKVEDKNE